MVAKSINILVDERPIEAQLGYTIMQTCSNVGVDIPRFCYHDKLLIAGNCRICLVEVTGSKKLVASCAVHVSDNMSVFTNTARVRLARQNVLEFLLANHPLDCPICDQGGECDLQDITALFGADRGRFYENEKRAVLNKDFGPLIRTSMNRCIHCTRCVRFLSSSSGVSVLGTLGRGSSTEIGTYINQFISDELSGNITDLCPVGALTSKPYSFKARPWELVSIRGIDVFDSVNSSLTFDVMANKICRVLPYSNDALNECWLTNKARYAYDGLFVQRLNSCLIRVSRFFYTSYGADINVLVPWLIRQYAISSFTKFSWNSAFSAFFKILSQPIFRKNVVLVGNSLDLESASGLQLFTNLLGGVSISSPLNSPVDSRICDWNYLYLFNTSLTKLARLPSFCLIIGTNLRMESPIVNLRITQLTASRGVAVFKIGGSAAYSTYKTKLISNSTNSFYSICEFRHIFCKNFYVPSFGYKPFIVASSALLFSRGGSVFCYALVEFVRRLSRICLISLKTKLQTPSEFSMFGFLHQYSTPIHLLSVGFCSRILKHDAYVFANGLSAKKMFLYSLGFEGSFDGSAEWSIAKYFVYQGTHGSGLSLEADLIFPSTTYVEKSSIFQNNWGSISKTEIVVNYEFGAKTDLDIFRGLVLFADLSFFKNFFTFSYKNSVLFNAALLLSKELALDSLSFSPHQAFTRAKYNTSFFFYYILSYGLPINFTKTVPNFAIAISVGKIFSNLLSSSLINYYGDNSSIFLTTSKTMSLCSTLSLKKNFSFTKIYY